ncbi:hypothetical protein PUN28_013330 [Cardiocondyla obscurior]|uniref:Uncharacterized protein n=1 Tax=Cardiocondyla obscurior TaxID=286306 RepID=A0AAW2FCY6_9HYME
MEITRCDSLPLSISSLSFSPFEIISKIMASVLGVVESKIPPCEIGPRISSAMHTYAKSNRRRRQPQRCVMNGFFREARTATRHSPLLRRPMGLPAPTTPGGPRPRVASPENIVDAENTVNPSLDSATGDRKVASDISTTWPIPHERTENTTTIAPSSATNPSSSSLRPDRRFSRHLLSTACFPFSFFSSFPLARSRPRPFRLPRGHIYDSGNKTVDTQAETHLQDSPKSNSRHGHVMYLSCLSE